MRRMFSIRVRLAVIGLLATLGLTAISKAAPVNAPAVEYTWTLAALGQGGWIGGPLFEDGTVGGGGALSTNNGQTVARFIPTGWTEDDQEVITVCFDVIQKKGTGLPSTLCVSGETTGTPTHIVIFGSDHVFRITENH
jgi:hypothetical protein